MKIYNLEENFLKEMKNNNIVSKLEEGIETFEIEITLEIPESSEEYCEFTDDQRNHYQMEKCKLNFKILIY